MNLHCRDGYNIGMVVVSEISQYEDKKIVFNGMKYALRCWGHPDNPVILMVHGWLDNVASFNGLAAFLAEQYYLIAVDLPGHGLSDHLPEGIQYHFLEMVMDLSGLCRHLEQKQMCLPVERVLGHSMGGSLLLLLTALRLNNIQFCISLESFGPTTMASESAIVDTLAKATHAKYHRNVRPPAEYSDLGAAVEARLKGGFSMTRAAAEILCQRNMMQSDSSAGFQWRTDARLRRPSMVRLTENQVLAFLKSLSCPVLVIQTEQGLLKHLQTLKHRIAAVEFLKYHQISGGHHAHMETQVGEIAQLLLDFLNVKVSKVGNDINGVQS